jgi:hypothetical protein
MEQGLATVAVASAMIDSHAKNEVIFLGTDTSKGSR